MGMWGFSLVLWTACSNDRSEVSQREGISEEPLEADDRFLMSLEQFSDWLTHWEKHGTDFDKEKFHLEQTMTFDPLEQPEINPVLHNHPLGKYQIPNPRGRGTVDIYNYKIQIDESGRVDFNPDSEVIYYKENGMRERLLFVGPSGSFEDAAWISPEHLMVAGFFEKEEGFSPVIWIVSVEDYEYKIYGNDFTTTSYDTESYLRNRLNDLIFAP